MKGFVTLQGADVIRHVLENLQRCREELRPHGKEVASDLLALAREELVSVQLHVPSGDNLDAEDFALSFEFDCPDEVYGEVTGQDLCKNCGKWSAFVKDPDADPPGCWCDFCRGAALAYHSYVPVGTGYGSLCKVCGRAELDDIHKGSRSRE